MPKKNLSVKNVQTFLLLFLAIFAGNGFAFDVGADLADKGYDADSFIELTVKALSIVVIPPRSNRSCQREYDTHQYKDRNLVERFFQKLKNFRRIATRYEKLDSNFMAIILIGVTYICLA